MQDIQTLTLITFFACFVSLSLGMLLAFRLFKSLKKNHAPYYKSIGRPIVIAPTTYSWDSYIQLLKSGSFMYSMLFRGIPKNFPKDTDLRKLAQAIRIVLAVMLVLFVALLILGYFLYKSGL